jgi:hypothetical protein
MKNIKQSLRLLLTCVIAILSTSGYADNLITVETDMPTELEAGGKRLVQVTIHKDQIQGFSKLEFTLPDGMTANAGDTKGGSFTFTGQKAKFIWMTLPEESTFSITYEIRVNDGLTGDYQIQGVFSYVNQNKREDLKLPAQRFHVRGESSETLEELVENNPRVRREPELIELLCSRTITRISDVEFLVKLTVVNNRIEGFGKILEILPDNCTTERENDGGAIITQEMHSIKFVWFEVPLSESFEVSYRVMCTSPEAMLTIRGELSYTQGGKPVTVKIDQVTESQEVAESNETTTDSQATDVNTTNDTDVAGNKTDDGAKNTDGLGTQTDQTANTNEGADDTAILTNENSTETTQQDQVQDKVEEVVEVVETVVEDPKTNEDANQSRNSDRENSGGAKVINRPNTDPNQRTNSAVSSTPESGVTYKVQILAAHRVVDKSYLKAKYGFVNKYNIENHEGWVKYTTGVFTEYEQAHDERERLKQVCRNLPGPFVTAYSYGERITVQEALLLSNQKWVE